MQVCPNCGEENPPRFRLCGFCGAALANAPPQQEVRKRVPILFCDLKGSASLGETLDSENFIGDAVMAVFGIPASARTTPCGPMRAAAKMQDALLRLNDELERSYGVRLANRSASTRARSSPAGAQPCRCPPPRAD